MTTLFSRLSFAASVVGILLATSGCTIMIKPPAKSFTGYPPAERINLNVGLQLTDELRKASAEAKALDGTRFVAQIGDNLCMNAEELSRRLFAQVKVSASDSDLKSAGADVILKPRVAYFSYMNAAGLIAIKLEWSVTDSAGKPIWVGTVNGEGKAPVLMRNDEHTLKIALENVFRNSHEAISRAPELREFAKRK